MTFDYKSEAVAKCITAIYENDDDDVSLDLGLVNTLDSPFYDTVTVGRYPSLNDGQFYIKCRKTFESNSAHDSNLMLDIDDYHQARKLAACLLAWADYAEAAVQKRNAKTEADFIKDRSQRQYEHLEKIHGPHLKGDAE